MLSQRVRRAEALLRRRQAAARADAQEAAAQVAGLRALLGQLGQDDPFPRLRPAAYLRAFWPWLLAGAAGWPAWVVEYALAVGGLPAAAARLARGGTAPASRPLRTAADAVALVHE